MHGVMLANNHMMDYGADGLTDTLGAFRQNCRVALGAGKDILEAQAPLYLDVAVHRSLCYRRKREEVSGHYATESHGGTACLNEQMFSEIARSRAEHQEAFIIVSPNWGTDFIQPRPADWSLARQITEAGTDCIIGHGPHSVEMSMDYGLMGNL